MSKDLLSLKKFKRICFLTLLLALMLCPLSAQAAGNTIPFTVTGLEEWDRLYLYALSVDGTWADSIGEWLQTDEGNEMYAGFLKQGPSVLGHLSEENAARFVQTVIQAMKQEDGSFLLKAADIVYSGSGGEAAASAELAEGYYMAVAEGKRRIYTPILLHVKEGEQTYAYGEDDWSIPKLKQTLLKNGETVAGGSLSVKIGDKLELSLTVTQGSYPKVYSLEKRICSVSQVYENGVLWKKDAFRLTGAGGRELRDGEDYTLNFSEDASVFRFGEQADAPAAFYRIGGWYYFMNGVVAGEELAQAVAQYNDAYHTFWEETDAQETEHCSVLCITFCVWEKELTVSCELESGSWRIGADEQLLDRILESQLLYSVSPISVDALGASDEKVTLSSRGIRLRLRDGGISGSPDPDTGPTENMSGAVFLVLSRAGTLENSPDAAAIQSFVEEHGGGSYQVIWNTDKTSADIYVAAAAMQTDENGMACIGGLDENDYLVIQTVYPDGYAVSRVGLLLTAADDWQEGSHIKDVTWTDYRGVYLPETGGCGTAVYQKAGILLLALSVIFAGIRLYRTNAAIQKCKTNGEKRCGR